MGYLFTSESVSEGHPDKVAEKFKWKDLSSLQPRKKMLKHRLIP